MQSNKLVFSLIYLICIFSIWGVYFSLENKTYDEKMYDLLSDMYLDSWREYDEKVEIGRNEKYGENWVKTPRFFVSAKTRLSRDEQMEGKKKSNEVGIVSFTAHITPKISSLTRLSCESNAIFIGWKSQNILIKRSNEEYIPSDSDVNRLLLKELKDQTGWTPQKIFEQTDIVRKDALVFANKLMLKYTIMHRIAAIIVSVSLTVVFIYFLSLKKRRNNKFEYTNKK